MKLLLQFILLIIGFVLLIKGADFFLDGASSTAKRLRVPSIIIGFTIVAMGTSLPECAVSITASISNNNALAVSNVIGSNIFNLMVVVGSCALFQVLPIKKDTLLKEFPFSVVCALLLLLLGYLSMSLGHIDGMIFIAIFVCYILYMIISALKQRTKEEDIEVLPVYKCFIYIIGGAVAIKYGGDFVVDSASYIASYFGLSQNLIGLTIVALGTSLPELATSMIAAKKNEVDMALGNAIGSNIFNILLVLGVASAISPIAFIYENIIDIVILVIMSIIVWIFGFTKHQLDKKEGIIMIALYVIYVIYICMR